MLPPCHRLSGPGVAGSSALGGSARRPQPASRWLWSGGDVPSSPSNAANVVEHVQNTSVVMTAGVVYAGPCRLMMDHARLPVLTEKELLSRLRITPDPPLPRRGGAAGHRAAPSAWSGLGCPSGWVAVTR